jgi:hypothetical protein
MKSESAHMQIMSLYCVVVIRGPYSQHFIFFETYKWSQNARVFVHGKPFQPSLMFASKVGTYLNEAPVR